MDTKNLSMPTMQDMRKSDWFYKVIMCCWNPLLLYFFEFFLVFFCKDTYLFIKVNFYGFVTCLSINSFVSIAAALTIY